MNPDQEMLDMGLNPNNTTDYLRHWQFCISRARVRLGLPHISAKKDAPIREINPNKCIKDCGGRYEVNIRKGIKTMYYKSFYNLDKARAARDIEYEKLGRSL